MNQSRVIIKNSLVTYASHAYEILIGILWFSLVARYLGQDGFGRYALLYVILHIIIAFSDSGVNSLLSRDIARDKEKAAYNFGATIVIRSIVTFIFLSILFIIFLVLRHSSSWSPDWITVGAALLFAVSHFSVRTSCTIFWAYERMEFESIIKFINASFMLIFLLSVKHWDLGLPGVFSALAFSKLIAALVGGMIRSRKFVRPKFPRDTSLLKYYAREGLPLGISAVVRKSYGQIDTIVLTILTSFSSVGVFNGAYRLIQRVSILPILVNRPFFPALSRLAKESRPKMEFLFQKAFKYLVIISLPLTIFLIAFAENIIFLLLGNEFAGSVIALQLLAPVVALMFPNMLFGYMLIVLHKQKIYTYGMLGSFAINLILDLLFIPYFGYKAACIANLLAESALTITLYYFLTRHIQPIPFFQLTARPMLSGLCTGLFLYIFKTMNVFILLPGAALLYIILLIIFKAVTLDEINLLKKTIRRGRKDLPEAAGFKKGQPSPASSPE